MTRDKFIISFVKLMFLSILAMFFVHYIQYQDVRNVFAWVGTNVKLVFLEFILFFCLMILFFALFNNVYIGYICVTLFFMLLSGISYLKYGMVGEVLKVGDIAFIKNVRQLGSFLDWSLLGNFALIFSFIFFIISVILIVKFRVKLKQKINFRIIIGGVTIIILVGLFGTKYSQDNILPVFDLDVNLRYSPEKIYDDNGIVLGMYTCLIQNKISEPIGYSKEKVFDILSKIEVKAQGNDIKPNVIVIMSEAFFDPKVLPNVEYNVDPISNIRSYISNFTSGTVVSSTFGGGTSNMEFEAFTGNSLAYLPYGICPFNELTQSFSNDIPTLQKDFKNNGYKTVAIHTYNSDLYQRTYVYPQIGFDEFIFESDIENPKYNGNYISDETLTDEIIKQLELNEKPVFVYGLSMQNHAPYSMSNFNEKGNVDITSDKLTKEAEDKLLAYVNGVSDTDNATKRLVDYLERSEKPTVLLFYGDHLPAQIDVFYETEFVSTNITQDWTAEELYKIHSIPFFIYDNFGFKENYIHNEQIGMTFLGNYLENYVGLNKSMFFNFLDKVNYCSIRDRLFIDEDKKLYSKPTERYKEIIEQYKILQYDILFGNNYINEYRLN